jgi:exopolysaccharide production protein ExoZ
MAAIDDSASRNVHMAWVRADHTYSQNVTYHKFCCYFGKEHVPVNGLPNSILDEEAKRQPSRFLAAIESQERGAVMTEISRGRGLSTLVSIQYLRACAAIMVVYYHIFSNRVAEHWAGGRNIGLSGVDIFFVISGFIMWTSTSHQRSSVLKFLKRRIYRVYPMWWMALTLWILMRFILPDRLHNADVTLTSVICSYLLIPHFHHVFIGRVWPILVPGWTLQVEIFFYIVFSLTLLIGDRTARLVAVIAALCGLAVVGSLAMPGGALLRVYTSPLLLEFAAGILLAALLQHLHRTPSYVGLVLAGFGLALLVINYRLIAEDGISRVLTLGIPASLIVTGALVCEPMLARGPSRLMLLLGDASYSLYLTHSVAISAAAVIWERLHLPAGRGVATVAFVPFALASSLIFAVIVYRYVEKPLLIRLLASRGGVPALPAELLNEEVFVGDAPILAIPSEDRPELYQRP